MAFLGKLKGSIVAKTQLVLQQSQKRDCWISVAQFMLNGKYQKMVSISKKTGISSLF
jgi:hypothetical protein